MNRLLCGGLLLLSTAAFAAHNNEWVGTIHNNRDLTTLHADGTRFELDFGILNLSGTVNRYDREKVSVRGMMSDSASRTGYPTIRVSSITFRPYGSAVIYDISDASSGYYTNYDRDLSRDRHDRDYYRDSYDRNYRFRRNNERPTYRDQTVRRYYP